MCSGFNNRWLLSLTALFLSAGCAFADTNVVSAIGTGRDTQDAIANLLKSSVTKYFHDEPAPLVRGILQTEMLPNAQSFVESYKITEGGKSGAVTLSASLDLDVVRGLFHFTPQNLGETAGAKALVVVRSPKLPEATKPGTKAPFLVLAEGARERFQRRSFGDGGSSFAEIQQGSEGEDISSPELLRGLANKTGARVVLGILGAFETYDNENSHNKEERLVITATMVDAKTGALLGRSSVSLVNPHTRKDQYLADLQRNIAEGSKDLFQDVFVMSGRKLVKAETHSEYCILRIQDPPSAAIVARFKSVLEGAGGVRSVVEYSIARGKFDFALRPQMDVAALRKILGNISAPEFTVSVLDAPKETDSHPPTITVTLAAKDGPSAEANPNAKR